MIYETEENRYKCPTGKHLNQCPTIQNNTATYLSKSSDCKVCNYSKLCPIKLKDKKKNIRIHTRHIHRDLFEKVKVWMTEEKFQENLVEHISTNYWPVLIPVIDSRVKCKIMLQ